MGRAPPVQAEGAGRGRGGGTPRPRDGRRSVGAGLDSLPWSGRWVQSRARGGCRNRGCLRWPAMPADALSACLSAEALPAAPSRRGRSWPRTPVVRSKELQHAAAELPWAEHEAGGAAAGGVIRRHSGLRDDVLPRPPGLRRHARPGAPRVSFWHLPSSRLLTLPQQTVPAGPAPQARPGCGPRLPCLFQPREPGRPDPGVGRLGFRGSSLTLAGAEACEHVRV